MSSCSLQTTDKMLTVNQNLSHFDGWQCSKASNEGSRRRSVLNVKVLVGALNQEKALCRGLLCEYKPSCGPSFAGLMLSVIMLYVAGEDTDDLMTGPSLELWPSCRLERTEIFEMKTRQKTAELLISPHSLYLLLLTDSTREPLT